MAAKKSVKAKGQAPKAAIPVAPVAPLPPEGMADIIARRNNRPEVLAEGIKLPPVTQKPLEPQKKPWYAFWSRHSEKKLIDSNLAAVKTGVMHEFESMSTQKGTPVMAGPFRSIVLPTRPKPRYGIKVLVVLLFVALFGAIMMVAGELSAPAPHMDTLTTEERLAAQPKPLPSMPADASTTAEVAALNAIEPAAAPQPAPVSRGQVKTEVEAAVAPAQLAQPVQPALKVLAATKAKRGEDAISLDLTLQNTGAKALPAGPVRITIADAAGRTLKEVTLTMETPLEAGATRSQTWTIPLNRANKLDGFVENIPLEALTLKARSGE